ncbi:hypothetical protein AVEN_83961-1 [Araneus ventricosus]|uniref:Uncharacterized protein n=1 Tax=Araneus ventricosus TaxID=182803 RepID=A0A4Y2BR23_ARAVE|nr:hypothetical protein AVEN_83961-1 [Araneus ventricosus]
MVGQQRKRPWWPSSKVWASKPEGFQARNPIPLKIVYWDECLKRRLLGLLDVKSYVGGQTSFHWCGAEVWAQLDNRDVLIQQPEKMEFQA